MTHKLRSYILNKAQAYLTDHSTSMKKILNQLSNIFLIEYNGVKRFAKALTKTQKQILALFDVEETILRSLT